jgi:hypothetical protein
MVFVRKLKTIFVAAITSVIFAPRPANAQILSKDNTRPQLKFTTADKRYAELQRARQQTLAILQADNACSAWFRESDPDAAEVFDSLHFEIVKDLSPYIYRKSVAYGEPLYKHPWAARAYEGSGRNSTIQINANGPFFNSTSPVLVMEAEGAFSRFGGNHPLTVASFPGSSAKAQVATLLHELGHIIQRIPEDDDSWDGRSGRNTEEVLRNCKKEIREYTQEVSHRRS